MGSKSALDWLAITKKGGETGWKLFYKEMLHLPVSQPDKFFRAVETFGHENLFRAIIAASFKKLEGDPLSYVLGIAMNNFAKELQEQKEASRYEFNMDKAKHRVTLQNEELEAKLESAKGIQSANID